MRSILMGLGFGLAMLIVVGVAAQTDISGVGGFTDPQESGLPLSGGTISGDLTVTGALKAASETVTGDTTSGAVPTCVVYNKSGALGCSQTGDTAPGSTLIRPPSAFGAATGTNRNGSALVLAGGAPAFVYTIEAADPSATCPGDIMTVTINGTPCQLEEGAGKAWVATASKATTAANLAAAITTCNGVDGVATATTAYLVVDHSELSPGNARTTIATSDALCASVSTNTPGPIQYAADFRPLVNGTILGLDTDGNTGWYTTADNIPAFKVNGVQEMLWSGNSLKSVHRVVLASPITDSDGACAIANAQNLTGFTFDVTAAAGVYRWLITGYITTAAATTGVGIGWNGPAMTFISQTCNVDAGAVLGNSTLTGIGAVTCGANATTGTMIVCRGEADPSADGTMQAVWATEVNASAVVLQEAVLEWGL